VFLPDLERVMMKFALMLDLGRTSPEISVEENLEQVTELVKLADEGGFDMVFCGEHHGHEMTIAPNPLTLLTYWAQHTSRVRLGTAVLSAPYWHPVRLAGEAALVDLLTGGRLELGIGRGAYPYEFARMAHGIEPEVARSQLEELLPALRGLWHGNYAHEGNAWSFPETTSTPRPLIPEGPPLWVSARHPDVFKLAVENRANLMVAPLHEGFGEVKSLRARCDAAVAEVDNGFIPQLMVLRNTCVYSPSTDVQEIVDHYIKGRGYFQNLFRTDGDVDQGWVAWTDPADEQHSNEYSVKSVTQKQMFGTADEVVTRLYSYKEVGTDVYLYSATWGLPFKQELESLRLFCEEVIPRFRQTD
jgi:alkanesulfonate monooxygenase SsuD/methylene tetrahydromethanopterin reductase-like flavin-dependent oxidoreductase (luciferase family)